MTSLLTRLALWWLRQVFPAKPAKPPQQDASYWIVDDPGVRRI